MANLLKSEKINNTVNFLKCIYLCIFTIYLVVREVYALIYFIDSFFVTGFFMAVALLFIGYDVLTNRFCFKTRYFTNLALFVIIALISCVLNLKYGMFSNLKAIAIFVIYALLIYPESFKDNNNRTLSACLHTGFFAMTFFSFASLIMYIFSIDYVCDNATKLKQQGFIASLGRLWGVFHDPNYLALFSLIAICTSVFIFVKSKSIFKKIILVLLDLIHISVLSLTGSKMGYVITVLAIFWLSIIFIFKKLSIKVIYRILATALAVIISVAAPVLVSNAVNSLMPALKNTVITVGGTEIFMNIHLLYDKIYTSGNLELVKGSADEIDINNIIYNNDNSPIDRLDDPAEISNGRFALWKDGLKLLAQRPLFGVSPRNITSFAVENNTDTLMNTTNSSIHNTYLEVLTGTGIIGGAIILLFLILAAIFVIKIALQFTPSIDIAISTTLVMIVAISAIFLPDIFFFQLNFAGLIFWLCLGYCLNSDKEAYKNSLAYKLLTKYFKRKSKS